MYRIIWYHDKLPHADQNSTEHTTRFESCLQVYDNMNLGRRIDPQWPEPEWRARGGRNSWHSWIPLENMEGPVVHRWTPCHAHPLHRYTIALHLANLGREGRQKLTKRVFCSNQSRNFGVA